MQAAKEKGFGLGVGGWAPTARWLGERINEQARADAERAKRERRTRALMRMWTSKRRLGLYPELLQRVRFCILLLDVLKAVSAVVGIPATICRLCLHRSSNGINRGYNHRRVAQKTDLEKK